MKISFFAFCFLISVATFSQKVEAIKMDKLKEVMSRDSEKVKVINFWASWCGPCVKELPYFDLLSQNNELEVTLVSLDFPENIMKAEKLLEKKGIASDSYLLDESEYIDNIDETWSGAIPATLIFDTEGNRYFYEKSFTKSELVELVKNISQK
ncbi:MAG: TlpA family protein disulfide reductase [Cyclobacteriaceae bacterium]